MRQPGSHLLRATPSPAILLLVLIHVLALGGCAGHPTASPRVGAEQVPAYDAAAADDAGPIRPAPILHLVYFHLADPADAPALLADCQELLPGIPGVLAYAAGTHLDTGRESVDGDYDVALLVGFPDVAAYQVYLRHEDHLELLARWGGKLTSYTIHDVLDQPGPLPSP